MAIACRYKARRIAKLVRKAWLGHQATTNQRALASWRGYRLRTWRRSATSAASAVGLKKASLCLCLLANNTNTFIFYMVGVVIHSGNSCDSHFFLSLSIWGAVKAEVMIIAGWVGGSNLVAIDLLDFIYLPVYALAVLFPLSIVSII